MIATEDLSNWWFTDVRIFESYDMCMLYDIGEVGQIL